MDGEYNQCVNINCNNADRYRSETERERGRGHIQHTLYGNEMCIIVMQIGCQVACWCFLDEERNMVIKVCCGAFSQQNAKYYYMCPESASFYKLFPHDLTLIYLEAERLAL